MKGVIIAGTGSGVGKTTLTAGILSSLSKRMKVQAFKVGPDFIDPMYHTAATGRFSRNLDSFMMDDQVIRNVVGYNSKDADICVVEGVRGLYEGFSGDSDLGSTAHIAKILGLPVVLVVDAGSLTRSAAAIVNGFKDFDPDVKVAGVILNKVSGPQHTDKLDVAMGRYCPGIRVLGKIRKDPGVTLGQRHLGLHTIKSFDAETAQGLEAVGDAVDLDGLVGLAEDFSVDLPDSSPFHSDDAHAKVAVPMDTAFSFYYRDNLDCLSASGLEPVYFDAVGGEPLPDADMAYLGGGYPELHAPEISANRDFLEGLSCMASEGKPIYGECGGLMTMCRSLETADGSVHGMAEVLDARTVFTNKRHGPTYAIAEATPANPFFTGRVKGHEYHYSDTYPSSNPVYGFDVLRGAGIADKKDGLVSDSCMGAYMHQHALSMGDWAKGFRKSLVRYDEHIRWR
ncbi:MAG: hydrogenobyrinic acid a,c-diamide synthase (glutamine-hydrolyzing) [Candidatus Methanomethylophilaceae archaeon]|nr:hydrogenobyrinic acid a,c-diamide synthase (glutamine-hydrolyzing) [Candidatus Methanomethylophilaceae archaeon]